jgi:hypothetical protein
MSKTIDNKIKGIKSKIKTGVASLLLGASLIGVNGCATSGVLGPREDSFLDSYQGYRVIRQNNDIYIEDTERTKSTRVTFTPDVNEPNAWITKDGKYLFYYEGNKNDGSDRNRYLQPLKDLPSSRIKITQPEADVYWEERHN